MSSLNKVLLIARLGRDPEVRYATTGAAVATFSVATSRSWKDKSTGERTEETEWHRCVAYDRLGEVVGEYLKKGSLVYLEGRLKTRKWQDNDGSDRYTTEVIVDHMQMLGGRGDSDQRGDAPQARAPAPKPTPAPAPRAAVPRTTGTGFDDMDDDIPF